MVTARVVRVEPPLPAVGVQNGTGGLEDCLAVLTKLNTRSQATQQPHVDIYRREMEMYVLPEFTRLYLHLPPTGNSLTGPPPGSG